MSRRTRQRSWKVRSSSRLSSAIPADWIHHDIAATVHCTVAAVECLIWVTASFLEVSARPSCDSQSVELTAPKLSFEADAESMARGVAIRGSTQGSVMRSQRSRFALAGILWHLPQESRQIRKPSLTDSARVAAFLLVDPEGSMRQTFDLTPLRGPNRRPKPRSRGRSREIPHR